MKYSLLFTVALSLVLVLIVIVYYLFSKIQAADPIASGTAKASDSLRTNAVNDYASKLSFISKDSAIIWPSDWQQVGSLQSGCTLQTQHCQITNEKCLNLSSLGKRTFSFPVDSISDSSEKHGYAVRRQGNYIEVIACFTESEAPITQKVRL